MPDPGTLSSREAPWPLRGYPRSSCRMSHRRIPHTLSPSRIAVMSAVDLVYVDNDHPLSRRAMISFSGVMGSSFILTPTAL